MERQAGPYYIIPEFKNFADELKIDVRDVDTFLKRPTAPPELSKKSGKLYNA